MLQDPSLVLLQSLCLLAAGVLLGFALVRFITGDWAACVVEVLLASVCLTNYLYLNWSGNRARGGSVLLMASLVLLNFLMVEGGEGDTGLYWLCFFPPLVFHLKGRLGGVRWT